MLGLQFAIGAVNDLVDASADAVVKPTKPIPAGLVTHRRAYLVAVIAAGWSLVASAQFGPVVLGLAIAMLAAGLSYDLVLKPTPWAGLAFAVAFPLLPVYAWWAVTGTLPPRSGFLLPVAALAGPMLQLANGLVDIDRDRMVGLRGPVVRLARRRALALLVALQVTVNGLAGFALSDSERSPPVAIAAVAAAMTITCVGVALSASRHAAMREGGWRCQAAGIVLLGLGWILALR